MIDVKQYFIESAIKNVKYFKMKLSMIEKISMKNLSEALKRKKRNIYLNESALYLSRSSRFKCCEFIS